MARGPIGGTVPGGCELTPKPENSLISPPGGPRNAKTMFFGVLDPAGSGWTESQPKRSHGDPKPTQFHVFRTSFWGPIPPRPKMSSEIDPDFFRDQSSALKNAPE